MRQCTAAEITPLASLTFKSVFLRRECKEIHLRRFSNKRQQGLSNQPTFRHATTVLYGEKLARLGGCPYYRKRVDPCGRANFRFLKF